MPSRALRILGSFVKQTLSPPARSGPLPHRDGVRPGGISIVGYDDRALAAQTNPPLTTVRQNVKLGATHLVDLLFRRMEGEPTDSITMAPELIIRESRGRKRRRQS
jgi:DNA-binding LacI/PurR family transcriptional regulator